MLQRTTTVSRMAIIIGWLNVLWLFGALGRAEDVPALIEKADESEAQYRVVWRAEPAVRYELQQSKDLQDWQTVPGFPSLTTQLAHDHVFIAQAERGFFRVLLQADYVRDRMPRVTWNHSYPAAILICFSLNAV